MEYNSALAPTVYDLAIPVNELIECTSEGHTIASQFGWAFSRVVAKGTGSQSIPNSAGPTCNWVRTFSMTPSFIRSRAI